MSRNHPCPYCDVEIDALDAIDAGRCPECRTIRSALYALAMEDVSRGDIEKHGEVWRISPAVRRALRERLEEMDDPAEESQYLNELRVVR